jgi:hypothetical protein
MLGNLRPRVVVPVLFDGYIVGTIVGVRVLGNGGEVRVLGNGGLDAEGGRSRGSRGSRGSRSGDQEEVAQIDVDRRGKGSGFGRSLSKGGPGHALRRR